MQGGKVWAGVEVRQGSVVVTEVRLATGGKGWVHADPPYDAGAGIVGLYATHLLYSVKLDGAAKGEL